MLQATLRFAQTAYASTKRLFSNLFFEDALGVETNRPVALKDLGLAHSDRVDYDPSPWLALRRILPRNEVGPDDVFADFGCGKGRVLVQAAGYPFRRLIGIELSPELHAVAGANLDRSLPPARRADVELVNKDVLDYAIPDDITVAYFYNPFAGAIFANVIDRLAASVRSRPRALRIIYVNPVEEAAVLAAGAKLTREVRGLRPGKTWSLRKSIRMYTLAPPPC